MDESNLPLYQAKANKLRGLARSAQRVKNRGTLLVTPPASANRLTGDSLRQIGDGPFRRSQNDTMPGNEFDRVKSLLHLE
jgi:hypothetical protein